MLTRQFSLETPRHQVETRFEELVHEGPSKAQHNTDIVKLIIRSTHAHRYELPAFTHMLSETRPNHTCLAVLGAHGVYTGCMKRWFGRLGLVLSRPPARLENAPSSRRTFNVHQHMACTKYYKYEYQTLLSREPDG
jgi:hypothetical protein